MNKQYPKANMLFEWDDAKAVSNQRKHEISFEQAAEAFEDPRARFIVDIDHSEDEERFQLIGLVGGVLLLLVVFTERHAIRIISARRATKQEGKLYDKR